MKKDLGTNLSVYNVHTSGGTFGKSKEVKLKKVNRLHIATNLLMGDAAGYFCSFDVLRMADKSLNFI